MTCGDTHVFVLVFLSISCIAVIERLFTQKTQVYENIYFWQQNDDWAIQAAHMYRGNKFQWIRTAGDVLSCCSWHDILKSNTCFVVAIADGYIVPHKVSSLTGCIKQVHSLLVKGNLAVFTYIYSTRNEYHKTVCRMCLSSWQQIVNWTEMVKSKVD